MTEIIAEIGSVHDGSFGNALALIDLAGEVGADAVKFQTHIAEAETTRDAPNPPYFKEETRYDYFERTAFSEKQWLQLRNHARSCGLKFGSSPFSVEAIDVLEDIGVDFLKIASGEVTNTLLLERCAASGLKVIMSSGMSDWRELDQAVGILSAGRGALVLMQCSSSYPCPPESVGLNVINEMRARWNLPVGFSDHTEGVAAAIAAATLGAKVIEKHLTFSRKMYGSDASLASEPDMFMAMVEAVRTVDVIMGHPVNKDDLTPYSTMKKTFEKSIVARVPIAEGVQIDLSMIALKKPGTGLKSDMLDAVLGRRLRKDIEPDHIFMETDFI